MATVVWNTQAIMTLGKAWQDTIVLIKKNYSLLGAWNYWNQKTVTLSITESEYYEITEVCRKIIFVSAILLFMGVVVVENPITVHVDNIRDILLLENTSVSQRTNHIDVHHHLTSDYIEDGTLKIQFSQS